MDMTQDGDSNEFNEFSVITPWWIPEIQVSQSFDLDQY
jgi:hypothetical protein